MEPVNKMDGDSLPVSAFTGNIDGQWETGASAYEKRGTAVTAVSYTHLDVYKRQKQCIVTSWII